jgi:TatD DNase family protein
MAQSMAQKEQTLYNNRRQDLTITAMADAHCHLDMLSSDDISSAIKSGVSMMISNGVDTKSNMKVLELSDNIHVYAALGVDPEHALMSDEELEFNLELVKSNFNRIVAIGEIGLDMKIAENFDAIERQRHVFGKFLDLAVSLKLPVCVHARSAINEVLLMLEDKGIQKAQLHFFEGNIEQVKRAERLGYMISVPPFRSAKRDNVIKYTAIDSIMAESDAPAAGKTPMDVKKSIEIVALVKGITFEKAAEMLLSNTKRFFNISTGFIRN